MLPSWRLALNTLAGRRWRTVLLTSAVVLSASLITAVSCAISSVQAGLERSLMQFLGSSDVRIVHPSLARFDASLLEKVRAWPEVELASGRLADSLTLLHPDRRVDPESGELLRITPDTIGIDLAIEQRFRDFVILEGRFPQTTNEILIDPLTAEELHVNAGDVLQVQQLGDPLLLTVAGIYERQKLGMLQHPRIYLDVSILRGERSGLSLLTSIYLILKDETEIEAFCAKYQTEVPRALVIEPAEMVKSGYDQRVRASRFGLIIASVLAFMCTGFIIVTGLTTGVTERQRELALLRAIGAARRQIVASQLLVGLFFGALGAVLGVPLGICFTLILVWRFGEYLTAGLDVNLLGLLLAGAGSIGAGVIGAIFPALLASRVTPLAAMTSRARPHRTRSLVLLSGVGVVCIVIQVLLYEADDPEWRFWAYAYAGLPILIVGLFLLAVPVFIIFAALFSPLVSPLLRLPRDLLHGSLLATPIRHGFTAGALMLGIAMLVATWASGTSIIQDWIGRIQFADAFAHRAAGLTPEQQRILADLPFVEQVCPISTLSVEIADRQVFGLTGITPRNVVLVGFDASQFFEMNSIDWIQGDPEQATARLRAGDGAIVADRFLIARNLGVGDQLTLRLGRITKQVEIVGVVSSDGLDIVTQSFGIGSAYFEFAISCVFLDYQVMADAFGVENAVILQMNLSDDVTDREAIARVTDAAPGVEFASGRWIRREMMSIAHGSLAVQSTIAIAAELLACLAMGSVIAASIRSRRFEFGVLRAMGAQRSTIVLLILGEAIVLGITAAVVGTIAGIYFARIDVLNMRYLAGLPINVRIPILPIVIGWSVLLMMTLLAALPAAIRLARRAPAHLVAAGQNE